MSIKQTEALVATARELGTRYPAAIAEATRFAQGEFGRGDLAEGVLAALADGPEAAELAVRAAAEETPPPPVLKLRPSSGGKRRFAVADLAPVVASDWYSGQEWAYSNQQWGAKVWARAHNRGYVAELVGSGQWGNQGDHGTYIGVGDTAEGALYAALPTMDDYGYGDEPPQSLVAPARDYDAEASPPPVE